jgi:hypothetical protein
MLRSKKMNYYKLVIPKDHDWEIISYLSTKGYMHLVDQNEHEISTNKSYQKTIRKIEDGLNNIRLIHEIIEEFRPNIAFKPVDEHKYVMNLGNAIVRSGKQERHYGLHVESVVESTLKEIKAQREIRENLLQLMLDREESILTHLVMQHKIGDGST